MKKLVFMSEEHTAEKVIKTANSIIGYMGDVEQFKLAGITDFSLFELQDLEGNPADYDQDPAEAIRLENEQLKARLTAAEAETQSTKEQLALTNADMQGFMELYFNNLGGV